MPSFLICGDPHGHFQHIQNALHNNAVDAVLLLGDLDLHSPLHSVFHDVCRKTSVHWIPGNHDTDNETAYQALFESEFADHNIHGKVVDICGVRVAGLGGVFRSKVWDGAKAPIYQSQADFIRRCGKGNLWKGGLPLRHRSSIFPSDVAALDGQKADILITHEAPNLHEHGNSVISALAKDLQVQCAFHGHHHESIAYPGGVWFGVGLRELQRIEINENGFTQLHLV